MISSIHKKEVTIVFITFYSDKKLPFYKKDEQNIEF